MSKISGDDISKIVNNDKLEDKIVEDDVNERGEANGKTKLKQDNEADEAN